MERKDVKRESGVVVTVEKKGTERGDGGTARKNKAKNGAKWENGVVITVEKNEAWREGA